MRSRLLTGSVVLVISALMLCSRVRVLGGLNGAPGFPVNTSALLDGTTLWLVRLPAAVQTYGGMVALGWVATAAVALAAARLLARERFSAASPPIRQGLLPSVAALLLLIVGVVITQAPIAHTALSGQGDALPMVSLRFYYAPLAASFVLISVAVAPLALNLKHWRLWLMQAAVTTAMLMCAYGSAAQSGTWAENTATQTRQAASLLASYATAALRVQSEQPCLVRLPIANATMTDIDLRFKASLSRSDPRVN